MQSFAKAASRPPKPKPVVKKEEDTAMALSDDGEADADDMPAPKKTAAETESLRQAKRKREEDLRQMMEEDEEEDEDEEKEPEDAEMEEPEPEPEPEPVKEEEKEPEEVVSASANGRRRGKRRVMKKKRILDDQGYMGKLITRNSPPKHGRSQRISHNPRGWMGVLFRRRHACACKEGNAKLYTHVICRRKAQEGAGSSSQRQPRKHHVIFCQEVAQRMYTNENPRLAFFSQT